MEFAPYLKVLNQTDGFGCGFLMCACFSHVFNLFVLLFMFALGFKFLQFKAPTPPSRNYLCDRKEKSNGFRSKVGSVDVNRKNVICLTRYRSEEGFVDGFDQKNVDFSTDGLDQKNMNSSFGFYSKNDFVDGLDQKKNMTCESRNKDFMDDSETGIIEKDEELEENECDDQVSLDEDQIFDVITLRKMVKKEKRRSNALYGELEKERMAAASAAEEAMAMLLRLQREKSFVEMESNQYRRIAEQKQEYDQEVIQRLQWMVMKQENERKVLEDKMTLSVKKPKMHVEGEMENVNTHKEIDSPGF